MKSWHPAGDGRLQLNQAVDLPIRPLHSLKQRIGHGVADTLRSALRIVYFKVCPIQGKGPANRLPDRGSHRPVIMLQLAKIAIGNANPRSHDGLAETQSQAQAATPFTCIEPLLSHAASFSKRRSEECRDGRAWVSTSRPRRSPYH